VPGSEQTVGFKVEVLEGRALPSSTLPPPFHAGADGQITFMPPGHADERSSQVVTDGAFHPPAFSPGSAAAEHAAVWTTGPNGAAGVFSPALHAYHLTTGFFGE
jgi:hypothetical protein